MSKGQAKVWTTVNRKYGGDLTVGRWLAWWEVYYDPISDAYSPDDPNDPTAVELFYMWAKEVREKHPNGLIPIYWFVQTSGGMATLEGMPHQYNHFRESEHRPEDWLTHFTDPEDADGHPLNWLSIPVVDKLWHKGRGDKGGFIQEATGWKPSILQPFVYLPALEAAVRAEEDQV